MKNKGLIIIFISIALAIGAIVFLTNENFQFATSEFASDGFILAAADENSKIGMGETENQQLFFNQGDKYLKRKDNSITFKTADGEKVNVENENYIHYTDTSMSSMTKSVVLDTDNISENQIVCYTIPKGNMLEKRNRGYAVNNGDQLLEVENFVWKLSGNRYMVVSPEIELVVDEDSTQKFDDYIQLEYKDGGVVDLINHDGTYKSISSAAYLELLNGVRIYLGSKNISNGDSVLMNMGQMLVNSSDEIEQSPDVAFRNESDTDPKIQVNATDGRDGADGEDGEDGKSGDAGKAGENGENGESGENGENGENGSTGQQGAAGGAGSPGSGGDPGINAKSYIYEEEGMPIVTALLNPSDKGTTGDVTVTLKDCVWNPKESYFSIIESSSGQEVWRGLVGDPVEGHTDLYHFECDSLKPGTNYTFVVDANYTPDTMDTPLNQEIYTKYFTTLNSGFDLKFKYSEENKIVAVITKTTESTQKAIFADIYLDGDLSTPYSSEIGVVHGQPIDAGKYPYNFYTGEINVENMKVNESFEIQYSTLARNRLYYMQLRDPNIGYGDSDYPYVDGRTLKHPPTLDRPTVSLVEKDNAFVITPVGIEDIDDGIMSYTYEIYDADKVTEHGFLGGPVYVADRKEAIDLQVPIDGEMVKRNTYYVCRIIAHFDNNDTMIDYPSPNSAPFVAGNAAWPTVFNEFDEARLTASTIEGTIIIEDEDRTLTVNDDYTIRLRYRPASGRDTREWMTVTTDVKPATASETGRYEIPYFISGLLANTKYTIEVIADHMTISSVSHNDVSIGTQSFTTKEKYGIVYETREYQPMKMLEKFDGDMTHAFVYDVAFFASPSEIQQSRASSFTTSARVSGLDSYVDFDGKSMAYLRFDLQGLDATGKWVNLSDLGKAVPYALYDEEVAAAVKEFGFGNKNLLYSEYYTPSASASSARYNLVLSNDNFSDEHIICDYTALKDYATTGLRIKVTAYDYCLANGKSGIFTSDNEIPIGSDEWDPTYPENPNDRYLVIHPIIPLPVIKEVVPSPVYRGDAYINRENYTAAINTTTPKATNSDYSDVAETYRKYRSNLNPGTDYDVLWEDVYDNTIVGFSIKNDDLAAYGKKIKYNIFDSPECTEADRVTTSYWIPTTKNSRQENVVEPWTFFFDNVDSETGKSISRGQQFWVTTEVYLDPNLFPEEVFGTQHIAPTEFPDQYEGLVTKEVSAPKQKPDIFIGQKNGTRYASCSIASYYFTYNDVDRALTYVQGAETPEEKTYDKIRFMIGIDSTRATASEVTIATNSDAPLDPENNPKYIIQDLKLDYHEKFSQPDWNERLYVSWNLNPWKEDESDTIQELVSDVSIIPRNTEYLNTIKEFPEAEQQAIIEKWNKDFSELGEFKTIKIAQTKDQVVLSYYVFTDNDITTREGIMKRNLFGNLGINIYKATNSEYTEKRTLTNFKTIYPEQPEAQFDIGGKHYYVYKINAEMKVSEVYEFADEESVFCEGVLSYDTGNYGLDYVQIYDPKLATVSEAKNTGGYALQAYGVKNYIKNNLLQDAIIRPEPTELKPLVKFGYSIAIDTSKLIYTVNRFANVCDMNQLASADASNLTVNGLSYIPREIKTRIIGDYISIKSVLPDVTGEVIPGVMSARMILHISPDSTIFDDTQTDNIRVTVTDMDHPELEPFVWTGLVDKDAKEETIKDIEIPGEGVSPTDVSLRKNTRYDIRIEAYATNKTTGVAQWYPIIRPGDPEPTDPTRPDGGDTNLVDFTTLKDVEVAFRNITYTAANTGRDDKTAHAPAQSISIRKQDLYGVDNITFTFTDASGATLSEGPAHTKTYTQEELINLFEAVNGVGAKEGTLIFEEYDPTTGTYLHCEPNFNWKPATQHTMNAETGYHAAVKVNYVNASTDIPFATMSQLSKPKDWKQGPTYQKVIADVDLKNGKADITAKVTANDPLRVFINNGNDLEVRLTLYEVIDQITGEYKKVERADNPKTVHTYYNNNNGTISPVTYKFENCVRGKQYIVRSEIVADFDNDGKYQPSTDPMVEPYYSFDTSVITIPGPESGSSVSYIGLTPGTPKGTVAVVGQQLSAVKKIRYTISWDGPSGKGTEESTLKESNNTLNPEVYHPHAGTVQDNYYDLLIPGMNDMHTNYVVNMEFYTSETDTEPIPVPVSAFYDAPSVGQALLNTLKSIFTN